MADDSLAGSVGVKMPESARKKPLKRLYRIDEAAEYLGRSPWSVRRLIWAGELPAVRHRRRVHVDVRDMEAFIDRNKFREVDTP